MTVFYIGLLGSVPTIEERSIKVLTLGINATFPFAYSSVSLAYILLEVNKYIRKFVSW